MNAEIESYKQRIITLEAELDEMTLALSQAWDQLTPLLQAPPEQAHSTQDMMPVLESIMTGIGAHKVAVFMLVSEECYSIPANVTFAPDLINRLKSLDSQSHVFQITVSDNSGGSDVDWLFAPIVAEGQAVGAVGVGLEADQKRFTAVDVRILERMAERTASQILVAYLAQSRERELLALRELQIANVIQSSIQPVKAPAAPRIQVASNWQPAKSVGGDAWGWMKRPNGEIGCFVLDVAGKGLPAALAAVSLHTAIKMALRLDLSVSDMLQLVNEEFYDIYARSELLATVCVLVIDSSRGCVKQANAGHLPTLIRLNGEWTRWEATAPPIGAIPVIKPVIQEIQLDFGDLILCYSDGFTEIEDEQGFWGEDGLLAAITPDSHDVEAIVRQVVQAAEHRRQSQPAHDDQTLVAIHMVGD